MPIRPELHRQEKSTTMARGKQSGELDQTVTDGTAVISLKPFQRAIRAMDMEATADETDNFMMLDMADAILEAESDEEIWEADERGVLNFQHLAGCDIIITDVHVKYGSGNTDIITPFQWEGRKMYLLVTVVRTSHETDRPEIRLPEPGEPFTVNTSAFFVVTKIWAFYTKGRINPDNGSSLAAYVKNVDLEGGKKVIKLRPARNASAA